MDKYKLTEVKEKNGSKITYIWHPMEIPVNVPVQQVYGFVQTSENLVALVRDKDEQRFTPPGGGVETGEDALTALFREFAEEAQFKPEDVKLLGSLEVINEGVVEEIQKHNLQVRFACKVGKLEQFIPMKDGFETEERIFIYYKDLPKYIGFIDKYTTGKMQYEMYCDYIEGKIQL